MTKNEERYANGNTKFKIKVIKVKEPPKLESLVDKLKPLQHQQNIQSQGIYQQMKNGNTVAYNRGNFSLKDMEDVFKKLYK